MRYAPLILALILCACTPTQAYYKPGATQEQVDRDKYDCEQEGWQYTTNMGFPGNPLIAGDHMHECMVRKHGYKVGPPQQ